MRENALINNENEKGGKAGEYKLIGSLCLNERRSIRHPYLI